MLKFTPIVHPLIKEYMDKEDLHKTISLVSSPCNIIFPNIIKENISKFEKIFKKYNINGKIFYAHKTNKSLSILKEAKKSKINVDVASLNELKSALNSGFTGLEIEATGPKNSDFIILGLQHDIIFNIDNIDELNQIINFQKILDKRSKTKILIRLSNFSSGTINIIKKNSRFGIDINDINKVLELFKNNNIELLGFSFHLDTIELKEKIIAINECLRLYEYCYSIGLNPNTIDIGGGYKVNYLEDQNEWNQSITELKESFVNKEQITWNGTTFGLSINNKSLRGTLNIYNYYDSLTGSKYLDELLGTKLEDYQNMCIGDILSENMIDLYIEPGKSLVDQLGITVARVNFIKQNQNETLIGLDMKRTDIVIGDQEIFMDPLIISDNKRLEQKKGIYFVGNLCLETDLIFKHKVYIDKMPSINDLVVFINTAGYFMDFNASDTIKQNIAKKLIAVKEKNTFNYYLDEIYNPFTIKGE